MIRPSLFRAMAGTPDWYVATRQDGIINGPYRSAKDGVRWIRARRAHLNPGRAQHLDGEFYSVVTDGPVYYIATATSLLADNQFTDPLGFVSGRIRRTAPGRYTTDDGQWDINRAIADPSSWQACPRSDAANAFCAAAAAAPFPTLIAAKAYVTSFYRQAPGRCGAASPATPTGVSRQPGAIG
jgi:hypothetical protein